MIKAKSIVFVLLATLLLTSCGKEEATPRGPSAINLSNNRLFELLPKETVVASLTTDIADDNMRFLLVSGEGDNDNAQFEILGTILRTKQPLKYTDGSTRSIRIKATDGTSEYETATTITIQAFEGTYPTISSPSFEANTLMPRKFGADHGNVSPDLNLSDIPQNTVSIIITMRDLDNGGSYHWAVWNIPPTTDRIFQGEQWSNGIIEGNSEYGEGYTGPFPPTEHDYEISAIFLTEMLSLQPNEYFLLTTSTTGKIIAQASVVGKYSPG